MMTNLTPPLPAVPTDNALTYALTLLAIAADPAGTKARMDELVGQITAIHAAFAEYDVAAAKANEGYGARGRGRHSGAKRIGPRAGCCECGDRC